MKGLASWSRRCAGLGLVLLSVLPFHRMLDPERAGPWARLALERAEVARGLMLWGTLTVLLVAVVVAVLGRRAGEGRSSSTPRAGPLTRLRDSIARPSPRAFALIVAALAGVLATAVALVLARGLYANVDEMASIIHARYLAAGRLGGPLPTSPEGWLIPNTLVVDGGWISQYPPGHLLVLAAFSLAGILWACGPFLFAVMAGFSAASFERLLPAEQRVTARAAALLFATSPFMLLLAAGALSHLTAGAAGAAACYCALRAVDGPRRWAVAAGAAMGIMVLARPWTGMVLGPALTLGVWLALGGPGLVARSVAPWVLGGVPAALALFGFNQALFGSPFTLGYEALYGPPHRIGFHVDPWGFDYGPREALAYTTSDLLDFGSTLLETPVSLVLVVGLYLALVPRLPEGVRVVAAWALIPVFGNALYWFHTARMLFESAPAWTLLAALAVSTLHASAGPALRAATVAGTAATLFVAWAALAPLRFAGHTWDEETLTRITVPEDAPEGALVFVHASWPERVATLLHAAGMRADSVESVVRRNDVCDVHLYAVARMSGVPAGALPAIELAQVADQPPGLESVRAAGGAVLRRLRGAAWPAACAREVAADRFGAVSLAPLLWQGDLPGLPAEGAPLFVRDYGPERNEAVRRAFPERPAFVFARRAEAAPPALLPYDETMALLWLPSP